ncbi:hypothetical protein NQZ68_033691 [Dissostichus eleginoides]|nr:hypothetical protein NQZ68_033691 [Dissostichus eleginoides]
MRPGLVVHQEEPWTHCTSAGSDIGSKDFILIPNGSQGAGFPPCRDPFTSVTCAQGEPALICEKHKAPSLVFYGKCQSSSTVLGSEHRDH